jgi:hypothetical protein
MDHTDHDRNACPFCGRDESVADTVLSRHTTSTGTLVWTRCACGALQARFHPYGTRTEEVVARGR